MSASAPVPIYLLLFFKCVAISGLGGGAYLITRCSPNWYLVKAEEDNESPSWYASNANPSTLSKSGKHRRCEGPWPDKTEPDFRSWCNNQSPDFPMFNCGPLGSIPGPVRTNYLLRSVNGGPYEPIASVVTQSNDDNLSFALVPASGTNGLASSSVTSILSADCVVTNVSTGFVTFKISYQ